MSPPSPADTVPNGPSVGERPDDAAATISGVDDDAPHHAAVASPSPEFLALIPHEFARRHLVLSAGVADGVEQLRAAPTCPATVLFNIGVRLGRASVRLSASADQLASAIDQAYEAAKTENAPKPGEEVVELNGALDVGSEVEAALRQAIAEGDVLNTHGKGPTVRLVDLVLFEALTRGASDVHVQPVRGKTLVRYRLDGVLHTVRELPGSLAAGVVSRIKIMARLDVAEQRAPQDGRASVTVGIASPGRTHRDLSPPSPGASGHLLSGRRVDLRVSTLPSTYGERVVVRILDPARSPHVKSFTALGMPTEIERRYLEQCSRTSGIVLSTGPTGSGKTTTLYATLAWLCATNTREDGVGCELNVMTVEDPVEYDLSDMTGAVRADPPGGVPAASPAARGLAISQTQVDPKKNVTFVTGLRHILRQDPDVIMVGEIRDEETARMAVQSSLTGHLVLSTLHTNDAPSAVARLLDLGVEPFLVASSLSAVLAQRLVRKVHAPCHGAGCHGSDGCVGTGYRGRVGVFELLVIDHAIRELACRAASAIDIKDAARKRGMVTLREAGSKLIAAGITTEEEVSRVIEAIEEQA